MMSKIANQIIVSPLPPPVGGVSSAALNLVRLFKQEGVLCEVFSTSSGDERENLYATKGFRSYFRNLLLLKNFITFLVKLKSFKCCHVFVVSNSAFIRDVLILLIAKLFRKKIIIHFHSKMKGEMFLSARLSFFLGLGLGTGDCVFVLSEKHKKHFSKRYSNIKFEILENYVFSQDYSGSLSRGNEWLYIGRLTEKKGFYDLIDAIEICVVNYGLRDLRIQCLGIAETDSLQYSLEDLIKGKGLENNLILRGVLQGADKFYLFRECAGLVFPSHFENSPVVLKEAISAGLPVIASDISANKIIMERAGNAVFFEVGLAKKLAKVLSNLASDEERRRKLSLSAEGSFKYDENYAKEVVWESVRKYCCE